MHSSYIMIQCFLILLFFNFNSCYFVKIGLYGYSTYSTSNYGSSECIGSDFQNMEIVTSKSVSFYSGNAYSTEISGITSARLLNLNDKSISYPLTCTKDKSDNINCDFNEKMSLGTYAFDVPEEIDSRDVVLQTITSKSNFTVTDPYTKFPHLSIYQSFTFADDDKILNIDVQYTTEIKNQTLHKLILNEKEVKCEIKNNLAVVCSITKEFFDSKEGKYSGAFYDPCGNSVCPVELNILIINGNKYGDSFGEIIIYILVFIVLFAIIGAGIFLLVRCILSKRKNKIDSDMINSVNSIEPKDKNEQNSIGLINK